MLKRIVGVVVALSMLAVGGFVFTSMQSSPLVAQQQEARERVGRVQAAHGNRSQAAMPNRSAGSPFAQIAQSSVGLKPTFGQQHGSFSSGNQNRTRPFSQRKTPSVEMMPLLRATYLLPSDAAETLTKLFDHKATALVECEIRTKDDGENELVELVVTAEPATQETVSGFIAAIFPEANIKNYLAEGSDNTNATGSRIKLSVNQQFVSLKLPGMT